MRGRLRRVAALFLLALSSLTLAQDGDQAALDLKSLPLANWLDAGEHTDIRWSIEVHDAFLRMDQLMEASYFARIDAKALNNGGTGRDLFFISRLSTIDGEWLSEPHVTRYSIEGELPGDSLAQYSVRFFAKPGDYFLWVVLVDRRTRQHNVARRRLHISGLKNDPLPDLYGKMPAVRFPDAVSSGKDSGVFVENELQLRVENRRPLNLDLISILSPPEQMAGGRTIGPFRGSRRTNTTPVDALRAVAQLKLDAGSLSIAGLDLVRREVLFEQDNLENVDWPAVQGALKQARSPAVTVSALQGAKSNGAFFRDYVAHRLADSDPDDPEHVFIVMGNSRLFASGSDLRPLQHEGDCHCRVYYLRFIETSNDLFDELGGLMKPLHPRTFNLFNAADLRKAIARIVADLGKL